MRKKIIIIVTVMLLAIVFRMIVSNNATDKNAAKIGTNAPAVTIAEVKTDNLIRQYELPARVMAKYRVEVLARISGYLTKSYFKEGDFVKAGQVLFEIEPQEYLYATNKAKANLDNINSQYDYYQKQLERYQELVSKDYIAKSDYDNILSQRNAYKAQLESAKSTYRDAQRNLNYTKVKSPVDGRVGIISVTVGNYVSMTSGPLTTINSSEPMYVTFPLESKSFAELTRIDKDANAKRNVEFIFSSGQKYSLKGVQDFHDIKSDETTGTITMRATFPNPNGELIQGDFGRIIIYSNQKDEMPVVPQTATIENQEGRYVYVLDKDNLPRMRYIKTMGQVGENWVVSDGIEAGETIITSGFKRVIPGTPVKIVNRYKEAKFSFENIE